MYDHRMAVDFPGLMPSSRHAENGNTADEHWYGYIALNSSSNSEQMHYGNDAASTIDLTTQSPDAEYYIECSYSAHATVQPRAQKQSQLSTVTASASSQHAP